MTPHADSPFPWAPIVATALFVVLTIWAVSARKRR
jgi:hypothetical protein